MAAVTEDGAVGAVGGASDGGVAAGAVPSSSQPGRELDLVVAAAALLVLVAYAPLLDQAPTTVRLLVVAPLGAAGLVVLARLAAVRDRPALWACGYLGWSLLAALASGNVRQSLVPGFGTDRGWLVVAAFIGWYAVGRRRGASGESLLLGAVVAGLVLNAVLALAQSAYDGQKLLSLSDGRSLGFTPSPVYLGTLLAGAVPLAAWCAGHRRGRWWLWLAPLALFAAAANTSGSRSGIAAGAVISLWVVRKAGWRRAASVVAAIVVGLALAQPLLDTGSATTRLGGAGGGGGLSPRVAMWEIALERSAARPVLGWGPNRFLDVATPEITAAFARNEGPDKVFFDAHNLPIEHLFSTGLPGLVLLGGFAVAAGRRAKGPLACFAAGAALTWLLEPASISSAPVILLALGVAGADGGVPRLRGAWRGVAIGATVVLVGASALAAGRLLYADHLVDRAVSTQSLEDAAAANRAVPGDPSISDVETQMLLRFANIDPARYGADAVRSAERTIRMEPDRVTWWYRLAEVQYAVGPGGDRARAAAARRSLLRAEELNPWSADVLEALVTVSDDLGDDAAATRWQARLCQIQDCDPG